MLTKKGIDLLPLLIEMQLWADKYYTIPVERKEIINAVKKDREGFVKKQKKILLDFVKNL